MIVSKRVMNCILDSEIREDRASEAGLGRFFTEIGGRWKERTDPLYTCISVFVAYGIFMA